MAEQRASNVTHLNGGGQRLFERHPADGFNALINRRAVKVINWSLGGLAIIDHSNSYEANQQVDIRLQLPTVEGFLKNCNVKARVTHKTEGGYTGFQFTDISPATAAMLHYIETCYRESRPIEASGMEAAASSAILQRNQDMQVEAKTHPAYHMIATIMLMLFVALAGSMLHQWFLRFEAPYAAITSPVITLTAPVDGRINWFHPPQKDVSYKEGEPLARVSNMELENRLKTTEIEIARQKSRLDILNNQLKKADRNAYYQRQAAKSVSNQRRAEQRAAAAAVKQTNEEYKRLRTLHRKGYVTLSNLQLAEQNYETAAARLAASKAQLREANDRGKVAEIFNNKDTPDEVTRDIAMVTTEIDFFEQKQQLIKEQLEQIKLDSPCDCTAIEFLATDGNWVKEGTPLVVLQQPEQNLEALVDWANIAQLAVGTKATIQLADNTKIEGAIQSIESSSNQPLVGLSRDVTKNPRYARVILASNEEYTGKPGQPLTVTFKTPNRFLNKLWFMP